MKKLLAIALTLSIVMVMCVGCGGNDSGSSDGAVKTGVGVVSSTEKSVEPKGDENGIAQTDSTVAAVTVDGDGKIVKCKLDGAQTKIEFTNKGKIVTPVDTIFKSKQDLGEEYGMGKASEIGKEWNEQATAFAKYCEGKTVDEVKGVAVNEEGAPTDEELASSVTISVGNFTAAVEKAVTNAKELGTNASDKLGLGVATHMEHSTDAGNEDGLAEAYTDYVAVTFDDSGVITSAAIEASQTEVTFDKSGKITSDLKAVPKSKQEIGDDYGLKAASGIGKEWYEQANSFAEYMTGKTIDEVKSIKVSEEGAPTDSELTSSVTIGVTDYISMAEKAAANAE